MAIKIKDTKRTAKKRASGSRRSPGRPTHRGSAYGGSTYRGASSGYYSYGSEAYKVAPDIVQEPVREVVKQQRLKTNIPHRFMTIFTAIIFFAGCLFIVLQLSQIQYKRMEITRLNKQLSVLLEENEALKAEISESMDIALIEQVAMGRLAMVRPDNQQLRYISVPKESYTELYADKKGDDDKKNILDFSLSKILSLFTKE